MSTLRALTGFFMTSQADCLAEVLESMHSRLGFGPHHAFPHALKSGRSLGRQDAVIVWVGYELDRTSPYGQEELFHSAAGQNARTIVTVARGRGYATVA